MFDFEPSFADPVIQKELAKKEKVYLTLIMAAVLYEVMQGKIFFLMTAKDKINDFLFNAEHTPHSPYYDTFFTGFIWANACSNVIHYLLTRTDAIAETLLKTKRKSAQEDLNHLIALRCLNHILLSQSSRDEEGYTTPQHSSANTSHISKQDKRQITKQIEDFIGLSYRKNIDEFLNNYYSIDHLDLNVHTIKNIIKTIGIIDTSLPLLTAPAHIHSFVKLVYGEKIANSSPLSSFTFMLVAGFIARIGACYAYYAFRVVDNMKSSQLLWMLTKHAWKSSGTTDNLIFSRSSLLASMFISIVTCTLDTSFIFFSMFPSMKYLIDSALGMLSLSENSWLAENSKSINWSITILAMVAYAITSFLNTWSKRVCEAFDVVNDAEILKHITKQGNGELNFDLESSQKAGDNVNAEHKPIQYIQRVLAPIKDSEDKAALLHKMAELLEAHQNGKISNNHCIKVCSSIQWFLFSTQLVTNSLSYLYFGANTLYNLITTCDTTTRRANYKPDNLSATAKDPYKLFANAGVNKEIITLAKEHNKKDKTELFWPIKCLAELNIFVFCAGVYTNAVMANFTTWTSIIDPSVQHEPFDQANKVIFTYISLRLGIFILEKVRRFGVVKFRDSIRKKAEDISFCQKARPHGYQEVNLSTFFREEHESYGTHQSKDATMSDNLLGPESTKQ
jgi:hypothetical protein